MAAFRNQGYRGSLSEMLNPGDTVLQPYSPTLIATVGAATIPASALISGLIYRSGSTAGYTDTLDSAVNIYNALVGSGNDPEIMAGLGFTCEIFNQVAFLETITLGAGMIAGSGVIASVPVSNSRQFLFQFQSIQKPVTLLGTLTSGSPNVTFVLTGSQVAIPQGPSPLALNITPGAAISGTGIPANTTVLSVTAGIGGNTGLVLSANATATATNALTVGPQIVVHGMGAGSL